MVYTIVILSVYKREYYHLPAAAKKLSLVFAQIRGKSKEMVSNNKKTHNDSWKKFVIRGSFSVFLSEKSEICMAEYASVDRYAE